MKLRDLNTIHAEKVLHDILTISTCVQTNNQTLKGLIISGERVITSFEEIKEVAFDIDGNSFGYLSGMDLKFFKKDFLNAKSFLEQNGLD